MMPTACHGSLPRPSQSVSLSRFCSEQFFAVLAPSKPKDQEHVVMVELNDYSAVLSGEGFSNYQKMNLDVYASGLRTSPEPVCSGAHIVVDCGWDALAYSCQAERESTAIVTRKGDFDCPLAMWAGGAAGLLFLVLISALAIVSLIIFCTSYGVS
jgi:hypothetical protein